MACLYQTIYSVFMKPALLKFCFLPLLLLFCVKGIGQAAKDDPAPFKTGGHLGSYYSLDSVESIKLHNWKGDHVLSKDKEKLVINHLKKYTYDSRGARLKPGHIWATIFFKNGTSLHFYCSGDGTNMTVSNKGRHTFLSKAKVNFDNY